MRAAEEDEKSTSTPGCDDDGDECPPGGRDADERASSANVQPYSIAV